jgi:hypothetical protein
MGIERILWSASYLYSHGINLSLHIHIPCYAFKLPIEQTKQLFWHVAFNLSIYLEESIIVGIWEGRTYFSWSMSGPPPSSTMIFSSWGINTLGLYKMAEIDKIKY